jgi:hypothetical protein
MISLVYDRTAADVTNRTEKGHYRYTDLNRVQGAITALRARLSAAGYYLPTIQALTTWYGNDIPRRNRMMNYLRSVQTLSGILPPIRTSSSFPTSMDGLNWAKANAIEEFLHRVDVAEENLEKAWYYCGDVYAGEVEA